MSKDTRKELVENICKILVTSHEVRYDKHRTPYFKRVKTNIELAETIVDSQIVPCYECEGSGKIYMVTDCHSCKGKGYIPAHEVIKIKDN